MSLPSNFALLGLSPTIRDNAAFLFLQTGVGGYIDMFIQSATGTPVNIMTITSGVNVSNTVYVNSLGNDSNGLRGSLSRPFATIEAALAASTVGDTIEVLPGSYSVTGNMFKDGTDYYFHKNSSVSLINNGRIEVPDLTVVGIDIRGYLYLVNNGNYPTPISLNGYPCNIEFELIDCGTGIISISGMSAGVHIKGQSSDHIFGSYFSSTSVNITDASSVVFENVDFYSSSVNFTSPDAMPGGQFIDCIFHGNQQATNPSMFNFTGKAHFDRCRFNTFARFFANSGAFNQIKNTEFNGGIVVSGTNYVENSVFNTTNFNRYPNYSLITNFGGNSLFANCYARNFNNTNYVNYTFIKSGNASGAANFNIANSFTSFKNVAGDTNVQFGTFSYSLGLK